MFHDGRKVKKHPKKTHIHTTAKAKASSNKREKKIFTLKMRYSLQQSDQRKKKVDKVFLVKQQRNLVKTWQGGGMVDTTGGAFLLTPWLIGIKYP